MRIETADPLMPDDVEAFDRFDPAAYAAGSAHGTWKLLRKTDPVRRDISPSGTPCWSFFLYQDCQAILRDATTFSSTSGALLTCVGEPDPAGGTTLALMDPPEHTRLRKPVTRALGPAAVRCRDAEIRAGVRSLVRPLVAGGEHDVAVVLRRLPMIASGPLMGVPEEFWESTVFHTMASIAPDDPTYRQGTRQETLVRAHSRLFRSIRTAVGVSRTSPDNLVHALMSTATDSHPMTERGVVLNLYSALVGGNTATLNVALHLLLRLAEHPELWQEVIDEPAIVPGLVEEAARWTTPAQQLVRRVTADVEVGGARLREGDWVVAWIGSANRDESAFAAPYRFDPRRSPNPHLAFGLGRHYCVGAAASRLLLITLVEELARHRTRFRLTRRPRHLVSAAVNGIASMPLEFTS